MDTGDPGSRAPRALVADDQAVVRDTLAAMLHMAGYDVTLVGSADEATAAADASFGLVLLDVDMPGGGLTALSSIKNKGVGARVVVMSGNPSHRAAALAKGADAFLTKPFGLEDLALTRPEHGDHGGSGARS